MLEESKPKSNHLNHLTINILKQPPINTILKLLVFKVEVIVIVIKICLENLDIPYGYYHRSRKRSPSYNNSPFRRYKSPFFFHPPKHVLIVVEVDYTRILICTLTAHTNFLLT